MRVTLTIDDDVLAFVRSLAAQRGQSLGAVLSGLARQGLVSQPDGAVRYRNCSALLPVSPGAKRITLALVNKLRDASP